MLPFFGMLLPRANPILVALGFDTGYSSQDTVNPTAVLTITVKRDGTWAIGVGVADTLVSGSPSSGSWCGNPSAEIGDQAEVQFVVANEVNTPTIVNDAASYTALTSDRTINISRGGGVTATADITINVRSAGVTVTDTTAVTVDGT